MGCLLEAGLSTPIDTPVTRTVAALVTRLYEDFDHMGGCVGAGLHIVTDDYNVDDGSLDFCERDLATHWSITGTRLFGLKPIAHSAEDIVALLALEREIIAALRPLSEHERLSAMAISTYGPDVVAVRGTR